MRPSSHLFSKPTGKPGRPPEDKKFPESPPNAPGKPKKKKA
jgi:hypothetical protein